jgi:hypothetical protein
MRQAFIAAVAFACATGAAAEPLPSRVGDCSATTVKKVETRLMNGESGQMSPDSGSAIEFANGGYQVSYEQVEAVDRSRAGDPVRLCLISIPKDCPPGDDRGRMYRATNLRTHGSWTLPDAEHMCGGA